MLSSKSLIFSSFHSSWKINHWVKTKFSTFTQPLCLYFSPILMEQPSKKKKKPDAQIQKMREDRKRKRLYKDIKYLKTQEKQLKPLDENEIPYRIVDDREKYVRQKPCLTVQTLEDRIDVHRMWSIYRSKRTAMDFYNIDRIQRAQHKALEELRMESPALYEEAIKYDETLLPFSANGVTSTPPIKNYDSPDGDYIDVSRKWEKIDLPGLEDHMKKKRQQLFAERASEKKKKKLEKLMEDIDD